MINKACSSSEHFLHNFCLHVSVRAGLQETRQSEMLCSVSDLQNDTLVNNTVHPFHASLEAPDSQGPVNSCEYGAAACHCIKCLLTHELSSVKQSNLLVCQA